MMHIRQWAAGAQAGLVFVAGTATAQAPRQFSGTGEPAVHEWRSGPGEASVIGRAGDEQPVRFSPRFIPAGVSPEADGHSAAAFLPDGSAVVVANRSSRTLALFDPITRELIRSIPLSGSPQSLAITPDGSRAVVACHFEARALIVDLASGLETVVPVGDNPVVARLTPSGARAVVSCNGPQAIYVIDVAAGVVERTIATGGYQTVFSVNFESLGVGFRSTGPVLADETTVLYPDYSNSRVRIIDITTGATTDVPTLSNPAGIAVANGKAYVSHYYPRTVVSEIDVADAAVTRMFSLGSTCNGPICVNPAGTRVVAAVHNACVVIDVPTGAVSWQLPTAAVNELLTTADGNYALAVGFYGSVISFDSQSIVGDSNAFVSCSLGAVSPVSSRAVMFSDTFGEDMVVVNAASPATRLSAGPSGPAPEGDRTRVLAFTPDGTKAIAISQFSQTATIVDTATGAHLAVAPTGRRPGGVAVTPNGTKAVIANRDGAAATVLNLSNYTVANVPISTRGDQVRISPNGLYAYIAVVSEGDGVWRINLNTLAAAGPKLPTGDMGSYFANFQSFSGMSLSGNGAALVACNSGTDSLTVIDAAGWAVVATVPLGFPLPARAIFSPDDSRIYVTCLNGNRVVVVSNAGAASAVLGSIPVGPSPTEMEITADGSRVYVQHADSVGVIDTAALTMPSTISFTTNPSIDAIALSPDEQRLYVSRSSGTWHFADGGYWESQSNVLSVVDTTTLGVIDEVPGHHLAAGLAITNDGAYLGMPNLMSDGMTLVATAPACHANCDGSTAVPVLNVADFACFLQKFAGQDPYANCDGSTEAPVLNVADFTCFLQKFAAGCP